MLGQVGGKPDKLSYLVGCQTLVHVAHCLIMHQLNGVPVGSQDLVNFLLAFHWPGVLWHQQLGLEAPHQVNSLGPQKRVPALCSPNGIQVWERPINVVGWKQSVLLRPVDDDLIWGFAWSVVQHQLNPSLTNLQFVLEHMGGGALKAGLGTEALFEPVTDARILMIFVV